MQNEHGPILVLQQQNPNCNAEAIALPPVMEKKKVGSACAADPEFTKKKLPLLEHNLSDVNRVSLGVYDSYEIQSVATPIH